jgi:predicted nucleic acid-binding Zn ribbon protein
VSGDAAAGRGPAAGEPAAAGAPADAGTPAARRSAAGEPAAGGAPSAGKLTGPQLARAALEAARAGGKAFSTKPRPANDGQSAKRRRWSGAGPDPRDPQPLGRMVRRLLTDRGWEQNAAEARVLGAWDSLVGADIADKCKPVSLRNGELTLAAESTAWAMQLRLLAPKLLGRLATEVGPAVVTKIRVHGPVGPSWKKGRLSVRGYGPRDTYG